MHKSCFICSLQWTLVWKDHILKCLFRTDTNTYCVCVHNRQCIEYTTRSSTHTRGSHIDAACRSVCNRDQNRIKRSTFFSGTDQFRATNVNWSTYFFRYLGGVATFCPLNSCRIKRSRASEWSDQAIKDDFHLLRFLILVTNASTGDVYVNTPWTHTKREQRLLLFYSSKSC